MRLMRPRTRTTGTARNARDIARIDRAAVRLHGNDRPCRWHVSDDPEVFVVPDGVLDMRVRAATGARTHRRHPGDLCHAGNGNAHAAPPRGVARVLVMADAAGAGTPMLRHPRCRAGIATASAATPARRRGRA